MSVYGFDESLNKKETPSKEEHEAVAGMVEDSGWLQPTILSPFKHDPNFNVRYRKVGKMVFLEGAVFTTQNIAAGGTPYTIFNLPEGFRPARGQYLVGKSGQRYTYYLRVYASGRVTASNYGTSVDEAMPKDTWLVVNAKFLVD